jgi:dTDP-L-rhamnose 4-epimerase
VLTVAKTLLSKNGCSIEPVITGNFRLGDIRHNYADLSKAKKILGFIPNYNFFTGVNKFVEWVNAQTVKDDKYNASIKEMKEKGLYK